MNDKTEYRLSRLAETRSVTIEEAAHLTRVEPGFILELIEEGVIEARETNSQLVISEIAVVRVRKAWSLRQDLGINLPGIALAIELLTELRRL